MPQGKKTQNQKLAISPKTRNQKRKPDSNPVPNTPAVTGIDNRYM